MIDKTKLLKTPFENRHIYINGGFLEIPSTGS